MCNIQRSISRQPRQRRAVADGLNDGIWDAAATLPTTRCVVQQSLAALIADDLGTDASIDWDKSMYTRFGCLMRRKSHKYERKSSNIKHLAEQFGWRSIAAPASCRDVYCSTLCNYHFRWHVLELYEHASSLVGQVYKPQTTLNTVVVAPWRCFVCSLVRQSHNHEKYRN